MATYKDNVRVATTGDITLSGTQTIDGVAVAVDDRVLVKDQDDGSENGIYEVASGAWSRATDADSSGLLGPETTVRVSEGDLNAHSEWSLVTQAPITLGTTALHFVKRELVFNVRDFGAIGDGETDDRGAIDSAIKAANAAGGGIVWFPIPQSAYLVDAPAPGYPEALETPAEAVLLRGERRGGTLGNPGAVIHAKTYDTLLYLAQETTGQPSLFNGVEDLHFICKDTDQATSPGWLAASAVTTISVNAAERRFRRNTGSFVADGFVVGQRIQPSGFSTARNNYARVIESFSVDEKDIIVTEASADLAGGLADEGGVGSEQITSPFEIAAGACIEARGGGACSIRNCQIEGFPIGIVLDGAALCRIEDTTIESAPEVGYSTPEVDGKGIWLVHGDTRGRGWTSAQGTTVTGNRIARCSGGGHKREIHIAGGHCNSVVDDHRGSNNEFEGLTAYYVEGAGLFELRRCITEGYEGAGSTALEFGLGNLDVEVSNCWLAADKPISIPGGVSQLCLSNNVLTVTNDAGGPALSLSLPSSVERCVAFNNWAPADDSFMVNMEIASGLSFNYDNLDGPSAGLGINKLSPAGALVDGVIANYEKPLLRVRDSDAKTYFEHSAPTLQRHFVNYAHDTLANDVGGGLKMCAESLTMDASAAAPHQLAVIDLPAGNSLAFITLTVNQWSTDDPEKRAVWRCSQLARRLEGLTPRLLADGPLEDDFAPIASAGFNHPTFAKGAFAAKVWQVAAAGPTYVDITTSFNGEDANDVSPFPTGAATDYMAVGFATPFAGLVFDYLGGVSGADGEVVWEYWDGDSWEALTGVADATSNFTAAEDDGYGVNWDLPTDWTAASMNGSDDLYYVRALVSDGFNVAPTLDQGFIGGKVAIRVYEHDDEATRASIHCEYLVTTAS